jgi:methionine-gamma-lyase
MTKYIGGRRDLIAGAYPGSRAFLAPVRTLRTFLGTMAGPWTGWIVLRSLEALRLRLTSQIQHACYAAAFLPDHSRVDRVHDLEHLDRGDPQWEIYPRQGLGREG